MARYTLATGEPVFTGFMRQRPGPRIWAVVYSLLHLAQVGWAGLGARRRLGPGRALLGRMPREEDRAVTLGLGYLLFLAAVGLVLAGRHLHRALESVEWIMMAWMLLFLAVLALLYVPGPVWTALGWASRAGRCGSRAAARAPGRRHARLAARRRLRRLLGRGRHHQRDAHLLAARQGLRHGGHGGRPAHRGGRADRPAAARGRDLPADRGQPRQVARVVALPPRRSLLAVDGGVPGRHGPAGGAGPRRGAAQHRRERPRRGRGVRARAGAALRRGALAARAAHRALDLLLDPGRHRGGLRPPRDRDAVDRGRAARREGAGLALLSGARALRAGRAASP